MSKIEDTALVSRVLVFGDTSAFDKLVIKHQSSVRRFLLNLTHGDEMLTDDLAQDTFLKAYINIQKFKGLAAFSTWLMRIAYNLYYDYYRKNQSKMEVFEANLPQIQIDTDETKTEDVDLEVLMQVLTPNEKAAVLLYYMDDQPIKKIAQIMDISTNNVKSHLHRARQKMKKQINGKDE